MNKSPLNINVPSAPSGIAKQTVIKNIKIKIKRMKVCVKEGNKESRSHKKTTNQTCNRNSTMDRNRS